MATPSEKLAEALEKLKQLQDQGIIAIKHTEISRVYRERLVENGFLKDAVKGLFRYPLLNSQAALHIGTVHTGNFSHGFSKINLVPGGVFPPNSLHSYTPVTGLSPVKLS